MNQYFKASEVENYVFYKVPKALFTDEKPRELMKADETNRDIIEVTYQPQSSKRSESRKTRLSVSMLYVAAIHSGCALRRTM